MLYINQADVRKRRGEKRKVADATVIESTKYLTQYSENPASILVGICQSHQLTKEFIQEFYSLITPVMFSTSYKLTTEMIEMYPSLFDEEELTRYLKDMPSKADEETLKENYEKAKEEYEKLKAEGLANGVAEEDLPFEEPEDPVKDITTEPYNLKKVGTVLHISYASEHLEIFQNNTMTGQAQNYGGDDEEEYITSEIEAAQMIIREATDDEVNNYASAFIGLSNKLDETILVRVKDEDIKNALILSVVSRDGSNLSSAVYKYLSNDMKEHILGDEDVSAEDFISALSDTKDLGWQLEMLQKVEDGRITLRTANSNSERNLLHLINALPEDRIPSLFKLQKYLPNGFTTRLCVYTLENKDLSEDQIIEMYPAMKAAGAYFALKNYAKKNGLNKLLENM